MTGCRTFPGKDSLTIVSGTLKGKGFACVVAKDGNVYSEVGIDSCDELVSLNNLQNGSYVKIEIIPDNTEKYPYLHPDGPWRMVIDSEADASWLTDANKKAALKAFKTWKNKAYDFNRDGVFDFDTDLAPLMTFNDITKVNSPDLQPEDVSSEAKGFFYELVSASVDNGRVGAKYRTAKPEPSGGRGGYSRPERRWRPGADRSAMQRNRRAFYRNRRMEQMDELRERRRCYQFPRRAEKRGRISGKPAGRLLQQSVHGPQCGLSNAQSADPTGRHSGCTTLRWKDRRTV